MCQMRSDENLGFKIYWQQQADKVHKVLTYACRNCVYFEEAAQTEEERGEKWLVYRNDLMAESKETAGVTQDLHTDPTLPRSRITCPYCKHRADILHGTQDQSKRNLTTMTLFYVCTSCNKPFQVTVPVYPSSTIFPAFPLDLKFSAMHFGRIRCSREMRPKGQGIYSMLLTSIPWPADTNHVKSGMGLQTLLFYTIYSSSISILIISVKQ
ncbi:hypothetical protein PTTG_04491 [Puccinia triticina 1-1 BBBD Race 1]|uniref:DNA-directed RNA polymerase II subunit RPB9 n=2 Tax=Puccinia triticina TaxID=208348 RepID=A0A0C4EUL0_PUCT1|nr:hypothetical protein PTTG_04491 [Puccinia triticina 1-1 BBBD Race 1]